MNKQEYLAQLSNALGALSADDRENAIGFYDEYLSDSGEENMDDIIKKLGTPQQLANTIVAEMRVAAAATAESEPDKRTAPKTHSPGEFSSVSVDTLSCRIRVLEGAKYDVQVDSYEPYLYEVTCKDGNLLVREVRKLFTFFSFRPQTVITITLPKQHLLKDLTLVNKSGTAELIGIQTQRSEFRLMSGSLKADRCQFGDFSANLTSGNLTVDSCSANRSNITVISGNVKLESFSSNGLQLNDTSGTVRIWGTLTGENNIKAISGSVHLSLQGKSRDFRKNIQMVSGSAKINGMKSKGFRDIDNQDAPYTLNVNTVSGSVSVDFSE